MEVFFKTVFEKLLGSVLLLAALPIVGYKVILLPYVVLDDPFGAKYKNIKT